MHSDRDSPVFLWLLASRSDAYSQKFASVAFNVHNINYVRNFCSSVLLFSRFFHEFTGINVEWQSIKTLYVLQPFIAFILRIYVINETIFLILNFCCKDLATRMNRLLIVCSLCATRDSRRFFWFISA